jgi:MFS family permease
LPQSTLKAASEGTIGALLEWYDFYIFATTSALAFGQLFFPGGDAVASTMSSFGAFAAGFVSLPLGGLLFGHIGDTMGRKVSLILTLLIVGLGTCLIGLLPTLSTDRALGAAGVVHSASRAGHRPRRRIWRRQSHRHRACPACRTRFLGQSDASHLTGRVVAGGRHVRPGLTCCRRMSFWRGAGGFPSSPAHRWCSLDCSSGCASRNRRSFARATHARVMRRVT